MSNQFDSSSIDERVRAAAAALGSGDERAGEPLYALLRPAVAREVQRYSGPGNLDNDDVVQDSLLATMDYVRRRKGFDGDLIRFTVTVARNRCRNLFHWHQRRPQVPVDTMQDWLADTNRSPLDILVEEETVSLLQKALDSMGELCRYLLRAFYLENRSIEEIRQQIGLSTVQGVYYRRNVCLQEAQQIFKERLGSCSFQRDDHRNDDGTSPPPVR